MNPHIKTWWSDDRQWFCILVKDPVTGHETTLSLTPLEAYELACAADKATVSKE